MKPAIFNTEMVRAILDLIKKNTRRPFSKYLKKIIDTAYALGEISNNGIDSDFSDGDKKYLMEFAPYKVGDIIYVRETFAACGAHEDDKTAVFYKATDGSNDRIIKMMCGGRWTPSIHMPKEYARLYLRVKDVRIERLNEISEEDAIAEGIERFKSGFKSYGKHFCENTICPPIESFSRLWESIYGNGSFDNRYVWVIDFEQISKEEAHNE